MKKEKVLTTKYLDESLKNISGVILEAVNVGFEENKKEHKKMEKDINTTKNLIDGYVNKQEEFKQEFVIMKE